MNTSQPLSYDDGALRRPLDGAHRAARMGSDILIADDDDSVRNSLVRLLRCHGYSTLTARDGAEALRLARQHRPLVILMDVQMPVMNGMEASRAIKAQVALREVQIIALGAAATSQSEVGALFARRLQKPCPAAVIVAAVEAAIFQHCFLQVMT